jgi:PAS domain S-box-containing protein
MTAKEAPERRARILVLIFCALSAGIILAGLLHYRSYGRQHRAQMADQLSAIAELKVHDLRQYRAERLGDAAVLCGNPAFSALARRYLAAPQDRDAKAQLQGWLENIRSSYEYDRVRLLDARGVTRLSLPPGLPPVNPLISRRSAQVLAAGRPEFQDFYLNEQDGKPYLSLLAPIRDTAKGGRPLGTVVLRIDPADFLYPFIQRWPGSSRTAETLLIRKDGGDILYLNELRFQKDAALKLRMPLTRTDIPAVAAVLGRTGVVEGVDYRGKATIAALLPVPGSPWFLAARIAASEVYRPLQRRFLLLAGFICVILVSSGLGLLLLWRRQGEEFYRKQYELAEKLRESGAIIERRDTRSTVLNHLLQLALRRLPMAELLELALDEVLGIPGMALQQKGAIFLTEGDSRTLVMSAQRNLSRDVLAACARVPFGRCLCGRAAHFAETQFSSGLDERHEVGYPGISPHGHYCVPLKSEGRVLGVITLYLDEGHRFDAEEAGFLTACADVLAGVMERRRAEAALSESEARIRAITDSAQDAILMMGPDGGISYWNPMAEKVFGYARQEALGKNLHEFLAPQRYHEAHRAAIGEFKKTGQGAAVGKTIELEAVRKGGEEISIALSLSSVQIGGEWAAIGIVRDITEAKRMNAEREAMIVELKEALAQVKTLSGFIPICGHCKKIRDDKGFWESVEKYVGRRSEAKFSHGVCPDCAKKFYGEYYQEGAPPKSEGTP